MIKRYGEPVKPGQRYRRRAGIYGVLLDGNAVLLTHQAAAGAGISVARRRH